MRLGVKMAQQPIIEIAEFPHDNRLWRIDYLGAITSKLQYNNNMMIKVILRPVSDSTTADFSQYIKFQVVNPEWKEHRKIAVNIGLLPILTIGSLWKNGVLLPKNAISKILTLDNLDINNEQARFTNSNDESYI